jgi:hypothetical protein
MQVSALLASLASVPLLAPCFEIMSAMPLLQRLCTGFLANEELPSITHPRSGVEILENWSWRALTPA